MFRFAKQEKKLAEVTLATGSVVGISYRDPTNEERIAYRAASFKRLGKKGKAQAEDAFNAGITFGCKVIVGLREGDFENEAGEAVSSEKTLPNGDTNPAYHEEWKSFLVEFLPDVVTIIAGVAFDGARVNAAAGSKEGEEEAEAEVPFGKK